MSFYTFYMFYFFIFLLIFFILIFIIFKDIIEYNLQPIDIDLNFVIMQRKSVKLMENVDLLSLRKSFEMTDEDIKNINRQDRIEFIKKILFFFLFFKKTKIYLQLKRNLKDLYIFLKFIYFLCKFTDKNFRVFVMNFTI